MLAYNLYKKNKKAKADGQAAGEAAAISEPSISGGTDTSTPQEKLIVEETREENAGADALPRSDTQKTFATIVRDKRAQRQQFIVLGITFFVDVAMPIILYVSLHETSYHTCIQLKGASINYDSRSLSSTHFVIVFPS